LAAVVPKFGCHRPFGRTYARLLATRWSLYVRLSLSSGQHNQDATLGDPWAPYRSITAWCLWRACDAQ